MTEEVEALPLLIKPDSVTVVTEQGPRTIHRSHANFNALREAIKDRDWEQVEQLADPVTAIASFVGAEGSALEVVGDQILYEGEALRGYLVTKIFEFMRSDLPVDHLLEFLENLQLNPSMRAREELYKFLETEDLPITEDGHFLAYKAVRQDFKDKHSGKIDNSVGRVVMMPRENVDDNQTVGCSKGLHAGSLEYVRGFGNEARGDVFLIVKIHPMDVVCIPNESCHKLRCCEYTVVSIMDGELVHHLYSNDGSTPMGGQKVPATSYCDEDDRGDWDDDTEEYEWGLDDEY